ncbi:cytochrome c [Rhodoferax sp. BLA1]|uniref:c-type cytochrome n=1 Tax=Rhodoferax sp. BLA1 TaxID=2576062 RepID=UPI0015D3B111|nr:cytochrome c [Rhodoferax sp. BLA1]
MTQSIACSGSSLLSAAAITSALILTGCAVEIDNQQPAQELAQETRAPGSVYTGWRVFQDRCAQCHGPDALGTAVAPDLLPRVYDMGQRRFVGLVLQRYDWNLPPGQARQEGAALDQLVDQIIQRRGPVVDMPAWQSEPRVTAHITDLFAYLSARANGTQGQGRPQP